MDSLFVSMDKSGVPGTGSHVLSKKASYYFTVNTVLKLCLLLPVPLAVDLLNTGTNSNTIKTMDMQIIVPSECSYLRQIPLLPE